MITDEEFRNTVESLIVGVTVHQDPKAPKRFYSAYIDGKLYRSDAKKKTVYTRKCDLVNSLRHNSELFRYLTDYYTERLYNEHPKWFDPMAAVWNKPYYWPLHQYREEVEAAVREKVDNWWNEHVEIREITSL